MPQQTHTAHSSSDQEKARRAKGQPKRKWRTGTQPALTLPDREQGPAYGKPQDTEPHLYWCQVCTHPLGFIAVACPTPQLSLHAAAGFDIIASWRLTCCPAEFNIRKASVQGQWWGVQGNMGSVWRAWTVICHPFYKSLSHRERIHHNL